MSENTTEERLSALEALAKSLNRRLEEQEAATADTGSYGQRLHKFKEELREAMRTHKDDIVTMLKKHNDDRTEMEKSFEQHFNMVSGAINTLFQGLNRLEARANVVWNTFNALVRMVERVWSGTDPKPTDRGSFEATFLAAGRQVWEEAMAHEKSELARMRAEKAEKGSVTPMVPKPADPIDKMVAELGVLAQRDLGGNKSDFAELRQLREEAARNEAAAQAARVKAEVSKIVKAATGKEGEPEVIITNEQQPES